MEIQKKRQWKVSLFLGFLILVAFMTLYSVVKTDNIVLIRIQPDDLIYHQDSFKGFLIKTPGCRIPDMDPSDETAKKYMKQEKNPECNKGIPALFSSNLTSIYLKRSSLSKYTNHSIKELSCCYESFHRVEPKNDEHDNKIEYTKKCIPFNVSARITDEFIRVSCHVNTTVIYTDFFSFIPIKSKNITKVNLETKPMNLLIVGLDAVSRLNFHRQMPKTAEFLKNISAVELLGYNKVGDNTFPNLIPVLTGLSETQLKDLCWNKDTNERFDTCPFIWNDYKARGFATAFGEDATWMGIFNYMRRGFVKQPTDYMWGPFDKEAENQIGNCDNKLNVHALCIGAREVYQLLLNYIRNYAAKMELEKIPYFGFFWGASISHDYFNTPHLGDNSYLNFFKKLKKYGHLDNTVMIFMSDHGIRWGDFRQTFQGRLEERLPFVFMVLPESFKRQYQEAYKNLLKNTRRLTTPYDLHETLKDILNPSVLTDLSSRYKNSSRGYSLFSEIRPARTCEDADIASHWCTCQHSVEIETNNSFVVDAANFAVSFMNQQLEGYAQCSNLTLYNISVATVMTHQEEILTEHDVKDYMINLETVPGNGRFEVTVRDTVGDNKTTRFEVMGTISRLNLYGEQSACITDFHLKLYCYCKSFLGFND